MGLQLPVTRAYHGPASESKLIHRGHVAKNLLPHLCRRGWKMKEPFSHILGSGNPKSLSNRPSLRWSLSAFQYTKPCKSA